MAIPVWALGAGGLGLAWLLFGTKDAKAAPKAKQAPPKPSPVFAPEPSAIQIKTVSKPIDQDERDRMTKAGAVSISTSPSGAETFRRPDGGLTTVMTTVDVVAGQASNSAFVNTQRDPLNIRSQPSSSSKAVGSAVKGSALQITGKIVSGPGSKKGWAPVQKPGTNIVGYAAVDYLSDIDIDPAFQGP